MNTLADRLRKAREEARLTQAELAIRARLKNQSIIGSLETGYRKSSSYIPALAEALGVSSIWLATGRGSIKSEAQPSDPDGDFVPVTRVNIKVSAGINGFRVEHLEGNGAPVFFRADWIASKKLNAQKLYALKVAGDSMEPNLWDGDLIVMNSADTTPKDGEVFVANYEGELVIKRLRRDSGAWWLDSDNTRHKPKRCDEHAELLGRVIYKQSERI